MHYESHCPPPAITIPSLPFLTIKNSFVTLICSHIASIYTTALSGSLKMKLLFPALLLLISLLLHSCRAQPPMDGAGVCGFKCSKRCSKAAVLDRCMKYCGICCQECKCVPSGTYGNKHECPCYRDKKNSKGKPKCP